MAKRLAQCLHPALPSGVHLKALETYDLIFKLVGAARLSNELFIYSAGNYLLLFVKQSFHVLYHTIFRSVSIACTCCNKCEASTIISL